MVPYVFILINIVCNVWKKTGKNNGKKIMILVDFFSNRTNNIRMNLNIIYSTIGLKEE